MIEFENQERTNNEKVVKNWSFLNKVTKGNSRKKQTIKNSLTITNKRLILESHSVDDNTTGINREEIAIDAIKGVQTGYSTKKSSSVGAKIAGAIFALLGLVLIILGFKADFGGDEIGKYLFIAIGALFFIMGISLLFVKAPANMYFKLVILSNIFPSNVINICTIVNQSAKGPTNNITLVSPSLKLVFFDPNIAKEIVETIGQLLLVEQN